MTGKMVLVPLLVLAGLVLGGTADRNINCDKMSPPCSCYMNNYQYDVTCPLLLFKVEFTNHFLNFQCSQSSEDSDVFSVLSGLSIKNDDTTSNYSAKFWLCPLPNTSFKELITNTGISNRLNTLLVQSYGNYSNKLQRKHFSGLEDVTDLFLNHNELTELPSDLFQDMGNLTYLDMKQNFIKLPRDIFQSTPLLRVLELGSNNMSDLPPGIFKNLNNLRLLNLWGNKLKHLTREVFHDIPNLESLDLNSNEIEVIRPDLFANLVKLKTLNLFGNAFTNLPPGLLSRNMELAEFYIHSNKRSNMILPREFLANLTKLKVVKLYDCKLTSIPEDIFLGSNNIQEIYLQLNSLTTLSVSVFKDLGNLQILDLSHNEISHLPDKVFFSAVNLKELKLNNNKLTKITSDLFAELTQLQVLHLHNNQLRKLTTGFETLNSLRVLDVSDNKLTTFSALFVDGWLGEYSVVHKCTELKELLLANNSLTKIYGDWRGVLFQLRTINLAYNNISSISASTGENPLHFLHDVSIDLSHNNISSVNFWDANLITNDLNNFTSSYERDMKTQRIKMNLDYNPFNCDCWMLPFIQFLRSDLAPVQYVFTINNPNLLCHSPPSLENMALNMIPYDALVCRISPLETIHQNYTCPRGCSCWYKTYNKANVINCEKAGLTELPQNISLSVAANHTEINLSENKLINFSLPRDPNYKNVTHFNLSRNKISHVNTTGVSTKIQEVDLSFNNLTWLSDDTVKMLNQAERLKSMKIYGNQWACECDAKELIRFIKKRDTPVDLLPNVTCGGSSVSVVEMEENVLCELEANSLVYLISALAFLIFVALVSTIVYFRYRTQINIYLFNSEWKILRRLVVHPDLDNDKVYDAFISYAHEDEEFVTSKLMPTLEDNGKFKLCVHFKDFVPGLPIADQILNSVTKSRRTIVVLSPNFLNSVWGKAEFQTAHHEAMKKGTTRVIVILYQDVGPIGDLEKELKAYLQMNTYLKWGTPSFWKQLHYAMPHPPENADDISCVFGCLPRISKKSDNVVLQHVQQKDGKVTYIMSETNEKDLKTSPLIIEQVNEKPKETENHKNGKVAAV